MRSPRRTGASVRARFAADDALVRVLGFNTLFYVSFGIGAWVARSRADGRLGRRSRSPLTVALARPRSLLLPRGAFVTQPGRVERLTVPGGSLVRRALSYAIAGGGVGAGRAPDPEPDDGRSPFSVVYWVRNLALPVGLAALRRARRCRCSELVLAFAMGQAAMILPLRSAASAASTRR